MLIGIEIALYVLVVNSFNDYMVGLSNQCKKRMRSAGRFTFKEHRQQIGDYIRGGCLLKRLFFLICTSTKIIERKIFYNNGYSDRMLKLKLKIKGQNERVYLVDNARSSAAPSKLSEAALET